MAPKRGLKLLGEHNWEHSELSPFLRYGQPPNLARIKHLIREGDTPKFSSLPLLLLARPSWLGTLTFGGAQRETVGNYSQTVRPTATQLGRHNARRPGRVHAKFQLRSPGGFCCAVLAGRLNRIESRARPPAGKQPAPAQRSVAAADSTPTRRNIAVYLSFYRTDSHQTWPE